MKSSKTVQATLKAAVKKAQEDVRKLEGDLKKGTLDRRKLESGFKKVRTELKAMYFFIFRL
jgi:hypothetical protein